MALDPIRDAKQISDAIGQMQFEEEDVELTLELARVPRPKLVILAPISAQCVLFSGNW